MKELQKIWANKYVRWGVILTAVVLVGYFLWKRRQNKQKEESEKTDTKEGSDTSTGAGGSKESATTTVYHPDKDGTMMAAVSEPSAGSPQIFVIPAKGDAVKLEQHLGLDNLAAGKTKTAATKTV